MPPPVPASTALTQYRLHHASLYSPAYCAEMLDYFNNATTSVMQKFEESYEEERGAKGASKKVKGTVRAVTGVIPTFERFANSIGVTTATLRDWAAKHPDFGYAHDRCREVLKGFLIQASAAGTIPPATAIFLMQSLTDMRSESTLVITTPQAAAERPEFASYTEAELLVLREALEKANALGITLMIQEPEGVEAQEAESDEHKS